METLFVELLSRTPETDCKLQCNAMQCKKTLLASSSLQQEIAHSLILKRNNLFQDEVGGGLRAQTGLVSVAVSILTQTICSVRSSLVFM